MLFRAQREDPNQKTTRRSSLVSIAGPFSECREALRNGRVPCPVCGNPLSSRGFAPPLGKVRGAGDVAGLGPGGERIRSWCATCRKGHTLLPASLAAHRADTAAVLGRAVWAHAHGSLGAGRIAAVLGVPVRTAAGWLAQARAFASRHLPAFTAMLESLGAGDEIPVIPGEDPVKEMLAILRMVSSAAARRWGDPGIGEWDAVNLICRGRFISGSLRSPFYPGLAYPGMA
jgi:hypothetical protein